MRAVVDRGDLSRADLSAWPDDHLEAQADLDGPVTVGRIGLAAALAWLSFRRLPDFRERAPRLARWYDRFNQRPSMRATPYEGETQD